MLNCFISVNTTETGRIEYGFWNTTSEIFKWESNIEWMHIGLKILNYWAQCNRGIKKERDWANLKVFSYLAYWELP